MLTALLLACDTPTQTADEAPTVNAAEQAAPLPEAPVAALQGTPKHALLLVVDTLRADVLAEADTPVLDALAAHGDQADRAWSGGTWTVPSVVTLLTGMPVREHGWDLPSARMGKYPRLPEVPTLPVVLREAGFATAGFYANPYLSQDLGFERGWDTWQRTGDRVVVKQLTKHVAGWEEGERHFLYVHLLGPHSPLRPNEASRLKHGVAASWIDEKIGFEVGVCKRNREEDARQQYGAAYTAVVEETDALVGQVLEALGEHAQDTVILVTSDHGELLGEHGVCGHGRHVWEQLTGVPMISRGVDLPASVGGANVAALLTGALGVEHTWPTPADQVLPLVSQREGQLALSTDGRHKAVWDAEGELAVYDLQADPAESKPLEAADTVGGLVAARAAWEAAHGASTAELEGEVQLAPEVVEELRALGYVD